MSIIIPMARPPAKTCTDYEQLGSHFGFHGARVETLAELKGAIQAALSATKAGKTAILNVHVSR